MGVTVIKKVLILCSLFALTLQSMRIVAAEAARSTFVDDVDSDTDTVVLDAVTVGRSEDQKSSFVFFPEQRARWIGYMEQQGRYDEISRIYETLQFASADHVGNEAAINRFESQLIAIFANNPDLITRIEDMRAAIQLKLPLFLQHILSSDPFWGSSEAWFRLGFCKTLSHAIWRAQNDAIARGRAFSLSYAKMKEIILIFVQFGINFQDCLTSYDKFIYVLQRDPSLYDLMQINRPVVQYVQTQTTQQDPVPKVATYAEVATQSSIPKSLTYAEIATQTLTPVVQEDSPLFGSEDVDDAASDLSMADRVTSDDDWLDDFGSVNDSDESNQEFEDVFGGHTLF